MQVVEVVLVLVLVLVVGISCSAPNGSWGRVPYRLARYKDIRYV